MNVQKKFVIIGAGYGGITAALRLSKKLSGYQDFSVHLVDKNNYHLLKTQLHKAAIWKREVAIPINSLISRHKIEFHMEEATRIDPDTKVVFMRRGSLQFDILVLALGSQTNFYGIPGLREHAFTLEKLNDARHIHDHISRHCLLAATEQNEQQRRKILRFVIGGGGLSGVEVAAEFADLISQCTKTYHVNPDEAEIVLVEAGSKLVPHLGTSLSESIHKEISAKGVRVLTDMKIASLTENSVRLSTGFVLQTKTLVWTGGTQTTDLFISSRIKTGHLGRIRVDSCLRALDYPFIYAIGDNALAVNPANGKPIPANAKFALQQGKLVADNIYASIIGADCKPYSPKVSGEVARLGKHLAAGWLALPTKKKITVIGYFASLLGIAIQKKHLLELRRLSRDWGIRK